MHLPLSLPSHLSSLLPFLNDNTKKKQQKHVTKKFSFRKTSHVGMEPSKTSQIHKMGMTPQHFYTIPTSCAILPIICTPQNSLHALSLYSLCSHVDVHAWRVSYVVGGCNVVATLNMADMVCLACMQKLWSAWAVLGLYGRLGI